MQRKQNLVPLLFSLIFLFYSCSVNKSNNLKDLYEDGKYDQVLALSQKSLKQEVNGEYLYYEALGYEAMGDSDKAYHAISLYLSLGTDVDYFYKDAHLLLCRVGSVMKDWEQVNACSHLLKEWGLLTPDYARLYYQALLQLELNEQANAVFVEYLKETIDPYQYVQLLITSHVAVDVLAEDLSKLSVNDQLALLELSASDTVASERARQLLFLALPLEQAFTDNETLQRVYRLLGTLYGYADMRVLSRKYNTLVIN